MPRTSFATANAAHTGTNPFVDREPLLRRVGRGQYERYRAGAPASPGAVEAGRVVPATPPLQASRPGSC